jgi:hypothetical protein
MTHPPSTPRPHIVKYLPYLVLALTLALVCYVRLRMLPVPLERDEGEYAYMGQLLLKGFAPFQHAYSMKLPGVSVMYALSMACFGQSSTGVHMALLLANFASTLCVYLLACRLMDRQAACLSAASFALLSLSQTVYGVFAHATQFILPFSLAGLLVLLRPNPNRRLLPLFSAGLCLGLAFLMKQPAALLGLFALIYFLWQALRQEGWDRSRVALGSLALLAGLALPYGLVLAWVVRAGTFDAFWFWTVTYAKEYSTGVPLGQGLQDLVHNFGVVYDPQAALYLLAAAGLVLLARHFRTTPYAPFLVGYLLFSFLAVCPGLYFRWHYFVLILPATALLIGCAGSHLSEWASRSAGSGTLGRLLPVLLVGAALCYGCYVERYFMFSYTPLEMSYHIYRTSPFPVAQEIGSYLKAHTSEKDTIAVLGSEPQIYFYADRLSSTPHIYMYSLMEDQPYAEQMQRDLISQVEAARPLYIVISKMSFSWLVNERSPQVLFDWFENRVLQGYRQVGVVEVYDTYSRSFWDAQAIGHEAPREQSLVVYKRVRL